MLRSRRGMTNEWTVFATAVRSPEVLLRAADYHILFGDSLVRKMLDKQSRREARWKRSIPLHKQLITMDESANNDAMTSCSRPLA